MIKLLLKAHSIVLSKGTMMIIVTIVSINFHSNFVILNTISLYLLL